MLSTDHTSQASIAASTAKGGKFWRADMLVLAGAMIGLWLITFAWQGFDIDALVSSSIKSESDAWMFALTVAPLYFLIKAIAASWGVIIGIPSLLTVGHLILARLTIKVRWMIAGAVTFLVFVGTPILLNRNEEMRIAEKYQHSDTAKLPNLTNRAVELPSDMPIPSSWVRPIRCSDHCIDLLTFGAVKSVTRSFPGEEGKASPTKISANYVLGPSGRDCAGPTFLDVCPHLANQELPSDRVVLVAGRAEKDRKDSAEVIIQRIFITDTRQPTVQPSFVTRYIFAKYPGLLNVAWKDGSFYLPRNGIPILSDESLEVQLFRTVAPSKTFRGKTYPFR